MVNPHKTTLISVYSNNLIGTIFFFDTRAVPYFFSDFRVVLPVPYGFKICQTAHTFLINAQIQHKFTFFGIDRTMPEETLRRPHCLKEKSQ